jgi:hypothetical protein
MILFIRLHKCMLIVMQINWAKNIEMFVLINIFLRIHMTHNVFVNSLAMAYEPIIMCLVLIVAYIPFKTHLALVMV